MALIVPALAFIVLNVIDLSSYIYMKMQVDLAAHEAVGFVRATCNTAAKLPATSPAGHCSATLTADMTSAAQQTTLGTRVTLGTPTEGYYCANTTGTLIAVGTLASPPANCSTVVAGSTAAPGLYMSVQANYTFNPMIPGASIASALTSPVQRLAWMRLK